MADEKVVIIASAGSIEVKKVGPGPDIEVKVQPAPGTPPS